MSFQALVNDKTNMIPGKNTKVFISTAFGLEEARPEKTADAATSATLTGTSAILNTAAGGFDVDLYEGTVICCKTDWTDVPFSDAYFDKYFTVREFTEAGTTAIPVFGTDQTVSAGDELRIVAWIPNFSADTADLGQSVTVITGMNFSDGTFEQKAAISGTATMSISGKKIYNDPAFTELKEAVTGLKVVVVCRVLPNLRGVDAGIGIVNDFSDTAPAADFMTQSSSMDISGAPISGTYRTAA